ncbi:hypothetical protein JR316_0005510 [Psilocybe cubensis]|uniref:Uncharacterized protein n=1 Tax=Psilocybe cubensis TaxID=181762 RepID=A0ACB8GZY0_PSICU|nr:hypothetical protein JR316_0005510 [Psilocybe cubensis]KAH9480992.1 hypothetical protein JR316_0005510 [Psilocybe cubensis]
MSYNTSISSKIMLAQNGADETEAVNHYPLSGVDGTTADIRQPLIPDMFEYWGITPRNDISNVVDKRLQDGNAVSPTLGVTHGPLNHESAAQETPMPVTDLSLDWTKLGDIDLTLMNEYFNDPAAMSWDNPPYHPPTSVQMDNIQGELAAPFASSSVACQESFNDSNIGRTMSHAPINSFDIVYEPTMGAISAPIFPFQQHMSVGTSRRQTNLPHQRGTPYRAIWSLPNPVPHHGQDDGLGYLGGAYSIQDTSILPSPAFGETRHQNGMSENQGRNELYGSGSTPVEPTSTRNAGSSGNSRSLIRKRAPRSSSGGANQGRKRAERIVRIDKYGNVVYKGMRPDVRTAREIEQ